MTPASRLLLEVIATSPEDARAAQEGGADRLELVADLPRGGMTPPESMIEGVLTAVRLPVRVMLRETESHEVESRAVRDRLLAGAVRLAALPLDGIVVGATVGGRVDAAFLRELLDAARHAATFHRAFEALDDPESGLQALLGLGRVDRVLTSGGAGSWTERAARLVRWAEVGGPSLRILVGGGVTLEALDDVAALPGIHEVHVGRAAREPADDRAPVSAGRVAALVSRLQAPGGA
jgi:copper homeostasis protein